MEAQRVRHVLIGFAKRQEGAGIHAWLQATARGNGLLNCLNCGQPDIMSANCGAGEGKQTLPSGAQQVIDLITNRSGHN
jgi:hypothetical protein